MYELSTCGSSFDTFLRVFKLDAKADGLEVALDDGAIVSHRTSPLSPRTMAPWLDPILDLALVRKMARRG